MTDHLHANCDALLQSLSEYMDDELSEEMCRIIKEHLESCGNCRAVFNTTRRTIDLVRLSPDEPAVLPEDVRRRLFKRLEIDGPLGPP